MALSSPLFQKYLNFNFKSRNIRSLHYSVYCFSTVFQNSNPPQLMLWTMYMENAPYGCMMLLATAHEKH